MGIIKNKTIKKYLYYLSLAGLFCACMLGVTFFMACFKDLGQIWMSFGFLVGIGLFSALKPLMKGLFFSNEGSLFFKRLSTKWKNGIETKNSMDKKQNRLYTFTSTGGMIKVLFLTIALIIAYLFALNGRYIKTDAEYYFDKWRCRMIEVGRWDRIE